jgi:hypothetical protein
MTEKDDPDRESLAQALEALRKQKASGTPRVNIEESVRHIRGRIYSVKDAQERARLFRECGELLKPF